MNTPYLYNVPIPKRVRVLIHTDCKNEADDQYALAHHLMTPRFEVTGIVAGHFEAKPDEMHQECSMIKSYNEVVMILDLMGLRDRYRVYKGAVRPMNSETEPQSSEGADYIIKEAMREHEMPLFVVFLGALTDLASAYLKQPEIANRMTAVWIGGGAWPSGGFEFNLLQDRHAANVVFQSRIPLWQVPSNVYKMMKVSITELQCKVRPYGKIGRYLFDQLVAFNNHYCKPTDWPQGESWCLGDQPTVSVLLENHENCWEWKIAPRFSEELSYIHGQNARPIRVYNSIDARLTFEDFFCKLMLNYPTSES